MKAKVMYSNYDNFTQGRMPRRITVLPKGRLIGNAVRLRSSPRYCKNDEDFLELMLCHWETGKVKSEDDFEPGDLP